MKLQRLFSILFLVGVISLPFTCFAQSNTSSRKKATTSTSTKKTSPSKEFGPEIFIQKGVFAYAFASNIESTLVKMGFTQNGDVYSKGGISVDSSDPLKIKITFSNPEERDKFIDQTKPYGYQWDGTTCLNGKQLSLDMEVEGNTLSLFFAD